MASFRNVQLSKWVIWIPFGIILAALVAAPILSVVLTSFRSESSSLSPDNYIQVFASARNWRAIWHTAVMGIAVVVVCILLAAPAAWLVARTDIPAPGFIRLSIISAFVIPPYLLAVGWILLGGPNAGLVNRLWTSLTGAASGPIDVFTFEGLVFVMAAHLFSLIFVFTSNALEYVPSELEEAAAILGATRWQTFWSATFPLVMPAFLSAIIITFLQAIALFAVPALIALPAKYSVLSLQLYQFFEFPPRVGEAAAYSVPLLALTAMLIWLQRRILGRRGYTTIAGKGGRRQLTRLGVLRWPLFVLMTLLLAATTFAPTLVLVIAAFSKAWALGFSPGNTTLDNFRYVLFEHTTALRSLTNTAIFATAASVIALAIAFTAAYMTERKLVPFSKALAMLCMTPIVIPGLILSIGFYATYAGPPFLLYGSGLILILAFTTRFLPLAFANSVAGLRSVDADMEHAVRILGGTRFTAIRAVTAPILKTNLFSGFILLFVPASQEVATAVFLSAPATVVTSVVLLNMTEEGNISQVAALGTILLALTLIVIGVGRGLVGRNLALRSEPGA